MSGNLVSGFSKPPFETYILSSWKEVLIKDNIKHIIKENCKLSLYATYCGVGELRRFHVPYAEIQRQLEGLP